MENVNIERLEGEPIILARAKGHVTVDELIEIYRITDELRKDMPKNIYRITDLRELESSFGDMMEMIKQASIRRGSSSSDPSVMVVFVGTNHWGKLFADAMRQGAFGGKHIPIFESLEEALSFVRNDILMQASNS